MSSRVCTHCGCSDIDVDAGRGDAVCTNCGSVLEDNIIVSEVQFAENSMGGANVVGQFVSSEGNKAHTLGSGFHTGMGRESRQITLQNGKNRISKLGSQLSLNQHCIDTAYNFFKMAVNRRLTRGRKTAHVVAACLYIVCRTEGTPHMLLDFSDVLQVDVYSLGRTYLQLSKELCINIPALDPCLYIQRFAHKLEFGDKTHEVAMTALRLVGRMKRDWMAQGRRPSGLCGAALLVAARIQDFNRNMKDIIKVVKIGEGTIRKRLAEFEQTPSSQLTIEEFQKIDLEEEMDPPCFTEGKKKAKIQQLEEQGQLPQLQTEIAKLQAEIEEAIEETNSRRCKRYQKPTDPPDSAGTPNETASECSEIVAVETTLSDLDEELVSYSQFIDSETLKEVLGDKASDPRILAKIKAAQSKKESENGDNSEEEEDLSSMPSSAASAVAGLRPTAASIGITDVVEKADGDGQGEENENGELDLEGIDDEELERFILTEDEVKIKTTIWMRANADFLKELQEKEERLAREAAEAGNKPEKKKRKNNRKKQDKTTANSAGEAIEKMLQEKKISSKINYDVLKDLNKGGPKKESKESAGPVLGAGPIEAMPVPLKSPLGKRFRRISSSDSRPNHKSLARNAPLMKRPKVEKLEVKPETKPEVIVESGPVAYDLEEAQEEDEDYEEDEEHVSAAQLLGAGVVDDYQDEGYDYDD